MFILRRIHPSGEQTNHIIGESYSFIGRSESYERFKECFKAYFEKEHYVDDDPTSDKDMQSVYGFITNGLFHQALYEDQKNFIMLASGTTFANVSLRRGMPY